uniref:Uncharacterized protein n=1 Tax=Physcomitrium patens TaxID=3218 RepID=A0A2K1J7N7_PHYPA|nr:hypothetical protein PHYPA_020650 [Physcomitrium patens]
MNCNLDLDWPCEAPCSSTNLAMWDLWGALLCPRCMKLRTTRPPLSPPQNSRN